jgi:ribonuclease HI
MPWTAHIDGGSRGNPGPAGAGVHIADPSGRTAFAGGFFLGKLTNNQAEYRGMLAALDVLERAGADDVEIVSDSQLMVRQINGEYRVKSADLAPLFQEARQRLGRFRQWKMRHVLRGENVRADKLANDAMDARRDVIAVDVLKLGSGSAAPASPAGPASERPAAQAPSGRAGTAGAPTSGVRTVDVYVLKPPAGGVCPGGLTRNMVFRFGSKVPAGLCVDGCAAVIEAVAALQASDGSGGEVMTPQCGRPGCGAVFEVRRPG